MRRQGGQRSGQALVVFVLVFPLLLSMASLGITVSSDRVNQLKAQRAADFAALSGAKAWAVEIQTSGNPLIEGPLGTSSWLSSASGPAVTAERTVGVNGVSVAVANACTVANTTTQLDVIYYEQPVTCGSSSAASVASAEVSIPPLAPLPSACIPSYQCIRVTVRQPLTATLGLPASVVQATAVSFATVSNLRAWGENVSGQLGIGTTGSPQSRPVDLGSLSDIKQVSAANESHTLALRSDGTVWAWGDNSQGQLGNATTTPSSLPVQVCASAGCASGYLKHVIAVSAGGDHLSVALCDDGTVWAWGNDSNGQLGNASSGGYSDLPVQVLKGAAALDEVRQIAAGADSAFAIRSDGTLWAWGANGSGELGDGSTADRSTAVAVSTLTNVTNVSTGVSHTVATTSDGNVWAWGDNSNNDLGDGTAAPQDSPVKVLASSGGWQFGRVKAISAAGFYTMALRSDGTVWGWGANGSGQLGDTSASDRAFPKEATLATSGPLNSQYVTQISAGGTTTGAKAATVAVRADGTVWAWGDNSDGQLGIGSPGVIQKSPQQVWGMTGTPNLTDGYSVASSGTHMIALVSDAMVAYDWGANESGELGNGNSTGPNTCGASACAWTPQQVVQISGVVSVGEGANHGQAILGDGTVWDWGRNDKGQLGVNSTSGPATCNGVPCSTVPVQVLNSSGSCCLTDMVMASTGGSYTLALRADGTVWAWGENTYAELGDGQLPSTQAESLIPVQVSGLTDVVAIASGSNHGLALKSDGTVWAWGRNSYGNLGNGEHDSLTTWGPQECQALPIPPASHIGCSSVPVQVCTGISGLGTCSSTLGNMISLSAGSQINVATSANGNLWAWSPNWDYGGATSWYAGEIKDTSDACCLSYVRTAIGRGSTAYILTAGGYALSIGANGPAGQLGVGTTTIPNPPFTNPPFTAGNSSRWPIGIDGPSMASGTCYSSGNTGSNCLSDIISFAGGGWDGLALKSDATVVGWGNNTQGELGDGNNASPDPTPLSVTGLTRVLALDGRNSTNIVRAGGTPVPTLVE